MGGGIYSLSKKDYEKEIDLTRIKPYGDTLNDGKIQISFTLPIESGEKALHAAMALAKKMGIQEPSVVHHQSLDEGFTFFIIYGEIMNLRIIGNAEIF